MPTPDEEARLERTKMSFGEHLEELRRALFRSLAALMCGLVIGLFFGWDIVDYIQEPLRKGLQEFYLRQAEAEQLRDLQERKAAGLDVPADLEAAAREMVEQALVPHEYYVSPDELAAALKDQYPDLSADLEAESASDADDPAALKREDMIRLRLYQPLEDDIRVRIVELNVQSPFVIYLKASLVAGAVIASPFIFYFIWEFIAAGLYRSERKYVYMYLPICLGLFFAGAALAFFKAFDYMLRFLFWFFEKMHIDPDMRLSEWVSLVILLPLGFGVSFQLPLVMLLLERIGIFTIESYLKKWRISIVVIAVLSMVLTPGGDLGSMMLMFVPLTGLYFLGILMCRYMPGGPLRRPGGAPPAKPEASAGS
jgi:sec-independent protein translocase protein TatC